MFFNFKISVVTIMVVYGLSVVDVDECVEVEGTCRHGRCDNLLGSFSCTCERGYRLSPNRDTCTGEISAQVSNCVSVCLSVCPSVCFINPVSFAKTAEPIDRLGC